ncbi:MAG: DUF971 domain-containing protein [Gammaproteobacteria bacterium]|nr:DUF971 domain-containing protein [Gammaproteobacteria bacterium]
MRKQVEKLHLHQQSRLLEVWFKDGQHCSLPVEYLRVFSPSAEVRGHGTGKPEAAYKEWNLPLNKEQVNINRIEAVGHYAVRLVFDDGHQSGVYSWDVLHELAEQKNQYWAHYVERCQSAGIERNI